MPGDSPGSTRADRGGPVKLFRDTGTTFRSRPVELESLTLDPPALPDRKIWTAGLRQTVLAVLVLLFVAVLWGEGALIAPALFLAVAAVAWAVHQGRWRSKTVAVFESVVEQTADSGRFPYESIDRQMLAEIPERWREWLTLHMHAVVGEMAMRREEIDTVETLRVLDEQQPAERKTVQKLRAALVGQILEEMLEDHLLSEEEEEAMRKLIGELDLPKELVSPELERLEHYGQIRRVIHEPLEEMGDPGVPLVRGEKAYVVVDPARLLNERVMERYQRDNVQYRELGYEIDLEGKLILTDRRMMIVGRGSREYRLNKVLDVTSDPHAGTVELTLSGRKSPVILTVEEPLLLATRIEKIIEEEVMEG